MRYAHTNIISSNWELLSEFYIKTFNCKIIPPVRNQSGEWLDRGTGLKNAKLKGVHLLLPGHGENGPSLEIYQYEELVQADAQLSNRMGFGHIAFEVENVSEVLEKLIKNGGKLYGEISHRSVLGIGELSFVYAKDPEGNIIELQNWEKSKVEDE